MGHDSGELARPVAALPALGLALVAAAVGFTPAFAGRGAVIPTIVAAALPVAITVALHRSSPLPRLAGGLAAWAVLAAFGAYGSLGALPSLAGGLRDGASRLLTSSVPVETRGDELAFVLFLIWGAAAAACELDRRRAGLAPALPVLALLAAALVGGAGSRPVPMVVPVLVAAALGGYAMLRAGFSTPGGVSRNRLLTGTAVVAGVAVAAAAVGPRLPGARARPRFDPRTATDPLVTRPAVSPLASLSASLSGAPETLFAAKAPPGGHQWRLTVLDRFDGQLWRSTASFRRAGRELPPESDLEVATTRLEQEVKLERLQGFFLPAAPRPVEVSEVGLGVDPEAGTLLVPRDRPVPRSYKVVSVVPRLDPVQLRLAAAAPARDSEVRAAAIPDSLRKVADQVTESSDSAFGKLAALQQHFRTGGFSYDAGPEAPSGHSLFHIGQLLNNRRGTAEQYASAFAVLALSLGYEARVAVGFRSNQFDPRTSTYTVRSTDAHAWPEVHFEGVGWVPFEPSPLEQSAAPDRETRPRDLPVEAAVRDEVADQAQPRPPGEQRGPDAGEDGRSSAQTVMLLVGALVLPLLVTAQVAVVVAKARRRWRRRSSPTPAGRVVGAWQESVDRLRERRLRVTPTMTSAEVVTSVTDSLGPSAPRALRSLAVVLDSTLFGHGSVGPQAADAAWSWADEVTAGLRYGLSPWARLRLLLSPSPLLRLRNERSIASLRGPGRGW